MSGSVFVVNLGGEGEVSNVLNQQPPYSAEPGWTSVTGESLVQLLRLGHRFLLCPNEAISLPDDCVDRVITNNVPIDWKTWRGQGVQSSEIKRILKPGGEWIDNGVVVWTKP